MHYLIAEILTAISEIKHWFKVKKRRKFEKENNLPKKRMISPLNKIYIVILIFSLPLLYFRFKKMGNRNINSTKNKIIEIQQILEAEKKHLGYYPNELKNIIRNNPLRKSIEYDSWKNKFNYHLSKDSLNYSLISLGEDKILNTADDIIASNK